MNENKLMDVIIRYFSDLDTFLVVSQFVVVFRTNFLSPINILRFENQ